MHLEKLDDILTRLRADDKTVLKELFQAYYTPVCNAIHRFIRDKNLVEDLAQEVFLRFWDKRQKINITSSVKAYLHRMAVNEALAHLRKNKRYHEEEFTADISSGEEVGAEEQYLYTELEDNIKAAIDSLPPKCRAVFQLSRYEELTYKEIAERMEISVKTVENQMGKALKVLRQKLKSYLHIFL